MVKHPAHAASDPHGKKHQGHDNGPLENGVSDKVGGKGGEDKFGNNTRASCCKQGCL